MYCIQGLQNTYYNNICIAATTLRLVGNSTSLPSSGRLEIYFSNEWGTVCADNIFNQIPADIACRELGFVGADTFGPVGSLG